MNYVLSINLEGADKADAQLDSLLSKMSKIGNLENIQMDKLIDESGILSAGEKIGDNLKKGIKKNLSGNWLGLTGELGGAVKKATLDLNKFWSDAVKNGSGSPSIKGLRDITGKDLAKVFSLPDINSIDKGILKGPRETGNILDFWGKSVLKGQVDQAIKGLKDPSGKDLKKVSDLPDINSIGKGIIKGLRETGGKDLAKVLSLPDINELTPKMDKMKVLFAGIATLFNPFVGARLLSDVIPKDKMSGGKGVTGAIFGAAGAAGYGEIFVVVKTLELAFKALVGAVRKTLEAYDNATKIYAKSLMSGLGVGFTVRRGMLAQVLGVDEKEVMMFGAALNYLNPRLAFASEQIARTAVPLTGVGWEFKILTENIKALWTEIASGLAPGIKSLISGFNDFLVVVGKVYAIEGIAKAFDAIIISIADAFGAIEIAFNGFVLTLKTVAFVISELIVTAINLVAKIPGASTIGIKPLDDSAMKKDYLDSVKAYGNEIRNYGKNFFGSDVSKTVPTPQSFMKQLPASTWEKMGLAVAGGGNSTNDLIRKSNVYLQVIARAVANNPSKTGFQFGMNPSTSQP